MINAFLILLMVVCAVGIIRQVVGHVRTTRWHVYRDGAWTEETRQENV